MQGASGLRLVQEFIFWLVITVLALVLGFYVPIIGLLAAAVITTPPIIFTMRYGTPAGTVFLLVITAILVFIFGKEIGVGFLCEFGVMSHSLTYGFRENFSHAKNILISFGFAVIAMGLLLLGVSLQRPELNFTQFVQKQIDTSISQSVETYKAMDIDREQKEMLLETAERVREFMFEAYAGVYAGLTLLIVTINCYSSEHFLIRLGYKLTPRTPFSRLVLPEQLIAGFILSASMVVSNILEVVQNQAFYLIGLNLLLIFITLYFIQGLAIVFYLGERSRLPSILKSVALAVILVQPFFLLIITGMGLFSVWFDIRKLKQHPSE